MATQDQPSIPFYYDQEQDSVRLLELPPELYDLITSNGGERLWLKSAQISSSTDGNTSPAHTVLCTNDTTYQLRQVQTSNTVLVLKPVAVQDDANGSPTPAITAFATCTSTLELQSQKSLRSMDIKSAAITLVENLLSYNDSDSHRTIPEGELKSKDVVLRDVPYSETECEQAWLEQLAFEWQGGSWRLAPELLLGTWISLLNQTTAQSIDLTDQISEMTVRDMLEENELPPQFVDALWIFLSKTKSKSTTLKNVISLDKKPMIEWIGEFLVSAPTDNEAGDSVWKVLEKWQELLPEKWRGEITTKDVLALRYRIRGITSGQSGQTEDAMDGEEQTGVKRPATASIKRNWHERFKRSRA